MALKPLVVAAVVAVASATVSAQEHSWDITIGIRGSLTTSAKLFYLPQDSSETIRSQYQSLTGLYGGAFEMRARPPGSSLFFALSVEYQRQTVSQRMLLASTNPPSVVPTENGYWMVPLEASINVDVPLGAEEVKLTMGAGFGAYYAERLLSVAGVSSQALHVHPVLGLHIRTGVEYQVFPLVTLIGELRFRHPQISTTNRFNEKTATVDGDVINLPQEEIPGRLDIDGMVVGLGVAVKIL